MISPIPWIGAVCVYLLYRIFPTSFNVLFLVNIWLFSMPHTFSTFTRSDLRKMKVASIVLGSVVFFLALTFLTSSTLGMVILYSCYFYWQQFHYGKQNLGVSHWEKSQKKTLVDEIFYLSIVGLSLAGLLNGEGQSFFGYMLYFPFKMNLAVEWLFAGMIVLTFAYGCYRPKQIPAAISHTLIFSFAYLYCEHFALGWLVLNVFHNLQYLKFMKAYEKNFSFLLLPVLLTGLLYVLQFHVLKNLVLFSVPLSLGLMLALNFTHYSFDAVIWKRRK